VIRQKLLTQRAQSLGLFQRVGELKGGAGDHGAAEEGGIVEFIGNIERLGVGDEADAHPGVGTQPVQLLSLKGAVEVEIVAHTHKGERDAIRRLSGQGHHAVLTLVDDLVGKLPSPLPVFPSHKRSPPAVDLELKYIIPRSFSQVGKRKAGDQFGIV